MNKPNPDETPAPERLRELRKARQMTQGQMADALGISRQTYNELERGRCVPGKRVADTLAREMGLTRYSVMAAFEEASRC